MFSSSSSSWSRRRQQQPLFRCLMRRSVMIAVLFSVAIVILKYQLQLRQNDENSSSRSSSSLRTADPPSLHHNDTNSTFSVAGAKVEPTNSSKDNEIPPFTTSKNDEIPPDTMDILHPKLPFPQSLMMQQEQAGKHITVIDCTLYNGEFIMPFRIAALYHVVDWFYITEGVHTYQGNRKPQLFKDLNAHLFEPFKDKIVWLLFDHTNLTRSQKNAVQRTTRKGLAWTMEYQQRSSPATHIRQHIEEGRLSHPLVVLNTDADEIPHPDVVAHFQPGGIYHQKVTTGVVQLEMVLFHYNLNWMSRLTNWRGGHTIPGMELVKKSESNIMDLHREAGGKPVIPNGGYHISYAFDVAGIRRKLESFAHTEFNREELKTDQNIYGAITTGTDVLHRERKDVATTHFSYKKQGRVHLYALHEELCRLQNVDPVTGGATLPVQPEKPSSSTTEADAMGPGIAFNSTTVHATTSNSMTNHSTTPTIVEAVLATYTINPPLKTFEEGPVMGNSVVPMPPKHQ